MIAASVERFSSNQPVEANWVGRSLRTMEFCLFRPQRSPSPSGGQGSRAHSRHSVSGASSSSSQSLYESHKSNIQNGRISGQSKSSTPTSWNAGLANRDTGLSSEQTRGSDRSRLRTPVLQSDTDEAVAVERNFADSSRALELPEKASRAAPRPLFSEMVNLDETSQAVANLSKLVKRDVSIDDKLSPIKSIDHRSFPRAPQPSAPNTSAVGMGFGPEFSDSVPVRRPIPQVPARRGSVSSVGVVSSRTSDTVSEPDAIVSSTSSTLRVDRFGASVSSSVEAVREQQIPPSPSAFRPMDETKESYPHEFPSKDRLQHLRETPDGEISFHGAKTAAAFLLDDEERNQNGTGDLDLSSITVGVTPAAARVRSRLEYLEGAKDHNASVSSAGGARGDSSFSCAKSTFKYVFDESDILDTTVSSPKTESTHRRVDMQGGNEPAMPMDHTYGAVHGWDGNQFPDRREPVDAVYHGVPNVMFAYPEDQMIADGNMNWYQYLAGNAGALAPGMATMYAPHMQGVPADQSTMMGPMPTYAYGQEAYGPGMQPHTMRSSVEGMNLRGAAAVPTKRSDAGAPMQPTGGDPISPVRPRRQPGAAPDERPRKGAPRDSGSKRGGGTVRGSRDGSLAPPSISPASKAHFNDLHRSIRELAQGAAAGGSRKPSGKGKAQLSFEESESMYTSVESKIMSFASSVIPEKHKWRLCLECAEQARKLGMVDKARNWYLTVTQAVPTAVDAWIEFSKFEEECGTQESTSSVLEEALMNCGSSEPLLLRAIKHYEQVGDLNAARSVLGATEQMPVDRSFKVLLEGALLEARCGNVSTARFVLKFLMKHVSWYGPIYYEAIRLEEKCENWSGAVAIVERGLEAIPHYGPLWFRALRVFEAQAQQELQKSQENGSASAQINLSKVRTLVKQAVRMISKELVWKIYFEGALIEDRAGNRDLTRNWLSKAALHAPANLKWKVWVGGARCDIDAGHPTRAQTLLARAAAEVPRKAKSVVALEQCHLDEFIGNIDRARASLEELKQASASEWKVFLEHVLLEIRCGNLEKATAVAEDALKTHRNTGRLWAVLIQLKSLEGDDAQEATLQRALKEVPKSGEVWCEGARLRMNPLSKQFSLSEAREYLDNAIKFTPQYGDSFIESLRLELMTEGENSDTGVVEQHCVNAEPNYGPLWFFCKETPLDSTRTVLRYAKRLLLKENYKHRSLYQQAILNCDTPWGRERFAEHLRSLTDSGRSYSRLMFMTGLVEFNNAYHNIQNLGEKNGVLKRRLIFGNFNSAS